jgi:hypothetical protein
VLRWFSYRPDRFEVAAIAATVAATFYFLWSHDFNWRAMVLAAGMLAAGWVSGDMLFDLWRRR